MKKIQSRVLLAFILLMAITASVAAGQTRLYEVQVDVYVDNELIVAPSAVVEEGRTAKIMIGSTVTELTVNSEGIINGKPIVSLLVDVQSLAAATAVDGRFNKVNSELENTPIAASTIYFDDTSQQKDPATVSVGAVDVSASVRRVEASKTAELLESAASTSSCSTDGESKDYQSRIMDGYYGTIGDGDCCSRPCQDGSGNTMTCCGATMCCGCGACCMP